MLDEKEVPFAIRLPVNSDLRGCEEIHAVRPPGRPPGYERVWCHEIEYRATPVDPERVNAAALCLHGLAFNLLNTFRALAGASDYIDEPPELGLRRARQLLLVPGRIVVSARRATLVIMDAALQSWLQAWRRLEAFHPPPAAV